MRRRADLLAVAAIALAVLVAALLLRRRFEAPPTGGAGPLRPAFP